MPKTKNEPTPGPWRLERGYFRGANDEIVAGQWWPKRDHPDSKMIIAAPETKRQRDALEIMLRRMLIDTDHPTAEARALLAECEAGDAP